jgi:alanine racemase
MSHFPIRPAWVEVNLSAIEHNARRLVALADDAHVLAMVKANAYGHGAVPVARAAVRGGVHWLGVVSLGEALELRHAHITTPILVTGYTPPEETPLAVENDVTLSVFTLDVARALADAARARNVRARVHLKVDTGMSRLGVSPDDAVMFARAVSALAPIEIEGVYTHLAAADVLNAWGETFTQTQVAKFRAVLRALEEAGIRPRYRHCANSPALLRLPEAHFNLIRSGILLYGLDPDPDVPRPPDLIPALAFKTRVAHVRDIAAQTYVGYGGAFRASRAMRIAILSVGYADGYRRALANKGQVLIHGTRAPIIGRVCMDQCFADVTHIEGVHAGDEAVLIGKQGAEEIRAEEVAAWAGTNNYEIITTISARLERRYL